MNFSDYAELEKRAEEHGMRISDEKRREVAARLRDLAPGSDWPKYVAVACGMDVSKMSNHFHTYTAQLCQHLAELIDRPTCHINETDHEFEDSVRCDRCRTTFKRPWEPFKYCPKCGASVDR